MSVFEVERIALVALCSNRSMMLGGASLLCVRNAGSSIIITLFNGKSVHLRPNCYCDPICYSGTLAERHRCALCVTLIFGSLGCLRGKCSRS